VSETTHVTQLSDIEGYSDPARPTWRPIRSALGVGAFGINAWESTEPGQELIETHDEVGGGAGGHPDSGGVLYNLACAEARAGLHDDALGPLERAVALEERFRELAQSDSDLESLRADERFPKAVA
jgi:hypothetical protein